LNKTVLFFLSDHGIRFGAVRHKKRFSHWDKCVSFSLIFPTNCLDMSITRSLVLDKTFCCEQVIWRYIKVWWRDETCSDDGRYKPY
jgi:hypothetical protein